MSVMTHHPIVSATSVGERPGRQRRKALRFMVIEDDTLQAIDLGTALEEMGHEVVAVAQHRHRAMTCLAAMGDDIDCAIVDLDLAGETAAGVLRELDRRCIPYLVATGMATADVKAMGLDCIVLEKPFVMQTLKDGIARVFG